MERPVVPFLDTTWDVSIFQDFLQFVAVRSFTADSSLLQPTGVCEHHTPHVTFFIDLHAHAWLKSCVCRARIMCHESSPCAHVFVLTLFDYSIFISLMTIFSLIILSFFFAHQPWSSTMWCTNSLCAPANEDLGTLAEYDPLTYQVHCAEGEEQQQNLFHTFSRQETIDFCVGTVARWDEHATKMQTAQPYGQTFEWKVRKFLVKWVERRVC